MTIQYTPNQKINNLVYIRDVEPYVSPNSSLKQRKALFLCECGNEFSAKINQVKSGNTKSCGCYHDKCCKERATKHGLAGHPLYVVWQGMKTRCYRRSHKHYKDYGGRGITICDEWIDDFKAFADWASGNGHRKGLQIDRIDNDGNYELSNCRFVTNAVNIRNSRSAKLTMEIAQKIRNTKLLLPKTTLKEFAKSYSVSINAIHCILTNRTWI